MAVWMDGWVEGKMDGRVGWRGGQVDGGREGPLLSLLFPGAQHRAWPEEAEETFVTERMHGPPTLLERGTL